MNSNDWLMLATSLNKRADYLHSLQYKTDQERLTIVILCNLESVCDDMCRKKALPVDDPGHRAMCD